MSLSQQVHVDIDSFDKTVIYYDLKVDQVLAGHHRFSFLWRYTDAVITDPEERDAMMRRYSGRDVIFTFTSTTTGTTLKAKGIIENLASVNRQGSSAGLQVTGISHTSYIDDMKKSRTFLDRNLQEILLDILPSETPGDFYQSASMTPTFKRRLPYSAQYNETTFEYIKRLATRHGQWFYWDGMRLQFGAIKDSKVKLVCGSSVHEFAAATHFSPQKASLAAYDYEKGAKIQATQRKVSEGSSDGLAAHMAQKQHDYFTRDMEVSAYTAQAAGQQELDEMAKLQAAAAAAYSATYSGVSYEPLGVGRAFMVMEGQVEYRLVAVSVQHLSDNHGNYRCTFTAIPADVAAPPYTDPHCFAHAESQPATVVDNNDPQGLGRIKVHFYWGTGGNQQTDWVRMVQPHSGVGKGFYFIPEIGEEVLVGFEGGNAEKPYIIGAHYNGKQSSGYATADNSFKVIKTQTGHYLEFEELKGIKLADKKGNIFHIDSTADTLNIEALKTINLKAPNINLTATENITTNAGMDIEEIAGRNKTTRVGLGKTLWVGLDYVTNVLGKMNVFVKGNYDSHTDKDRNVTGLEGVATHSDTTINHNAKTELQNNSIEKTNMF